MRRRKRERTAHPDRCRVPHLTALRDVHSIMGFNKAAESMRVKTVEVCPNCDLPPNDAYMDE